MKLRVVGFPSKRILPSPEEGLRSLAERAPQAEAWATRVMARLYPTLSLLYGIRRRLATGTVAVLTAWLFLHIMFGANGMVVYRQKKAEYDGLHKEIGHLQQENGGYSREIKDLQTDPKAIEKEAREQLHYVRPGEVVYVSPEPPASQQQDTNAARR